MNQRAKILVMVVAACIAMGAGFWLSFSQQQSPVGTSLNAEQVAGFHGTVLPVARQLAVPELKKSDGSDFVTADLTGHWSLLFFGYTSCPDICPTTMNTLAAAKKKFPGLFPQVYFISVDPQRDTVKKLSAYVKYFDKDFIGITGSEKMLGAMALQSSVVFAKMPADSDSDNDYLVDHSSSLLLINPQAQLVAFINPPHTPEAVLTAVKLLSEK